MALETNRIIKIKRQQQSLNKLLTSVKLSIKTKTSQVKKCNRPNCGTWIFFLVGPTYKFKLGQMFTIKYDFTCGLKNLICSQMWGCSGDYIGKLWGINLRFTSNSGPHHKENSRKQAPRLKSRTHKF